MVAVTARDRGAGRAQGVGEHGRPDIGLRLEAAAAGGLLAGPPTARDQMVEYAGETILLVDGGLSEVLSGTLLDCKTVGQETQLVIRRVGEIAPAGEKNGTFH
jgi:hypothetical protein